MNILSIETSADETGVTIVEALGDFPTATYNVLGNAVRTQIEMHREYGGIFPAMAKREHALALVPLLEAAVAEHGYKKESISDIEPELEEKIRTILEREPSLADNLLTFHKEHGPLPIELVAVTSGPGLEPALWVGVNFARALSLLWNVPMVPVNHMEGHILASIFDVEEDDELTRIEFPALSLLISGGHTELVRMDDWAQYEKIGQTRDDAVGEAFDKVARMMGLPYPGGPEIGARAKRARLKNLPQFTELPLPMLHSGDLDMSFSGLKTAVRYAIEGKELTEEQKEALSRDFEDVVTEILLKKTSAAIEDCGAHTLIVGGGVSASPHLRHEFNKYFLEHYPDISVYFPVPGLSTDNSLMIALAGHARLSEALAPRATDLIRADGNRSLSNE
ncbi:MAG: tRNA (adenosine(37)-N6)-threonylcarbamoyltransferase complex transferase subunit TsaD [Patescibacteria group bacterium]